MIMGAPIITRVTGTPTHDGEAAVVISVGFPGGGQSDIHMSGEEAEEVVRRAEVSAPCDLVGREWTVLKIRETSFVG